MVEKPLFATPQSAWQTIISSKQFQEDKKTGKILKHISHQADEIANNDADYFLVKMSGEIKIETFNEAHEITIAQSSEELLNLKNLNKESDLPFFCFEEEDDKEADNLNFNTLKKCKQYAEDKEKKFFIVKDLEKKFAQKISSQQENDDNSGLNTKTFSFVFEITSKDNINTTGTITSIFNKEFSPEKINTTT